jgi:folylpolyglutamate synthase/dihydropteroate synthase
MVHTTLMELERFDVIDEFYGSSAAVTLVFGVMSDKALEEMIDALFPAAHTRIAVRIDNPRSVDPHETF